MKVGTILGHSILNQVNSNLKNTQNNDSTGNRVNLPGNHNGIGSLQRQIKQLQDQMKRISESDAPEDTKTEQIKQLQQQIDELKKQATEKKEDKSEDKDPTAKQLKDMGFAVVDKNLINGITEAASSMKLAHTARAEYVAAEGRHDEAAMARAMGYQNAYTAKAQKSVKNSSSSVQEEHTQSTKNNESGSVAEDSQNFRAHDIAGKSSTSSVESDPKSKQSSGVGVVQLRQASEMQRVSDTEFPKPDVKRSLNKKV